MSLTSFIYKDPFPCRSTKKWRSVDPHTYDISNNRTLRSLRFVTQGPLRSFPDLVSVSVWKSEGLGPLWFLSTLWSSPLLVRQGPGYGSPLRVPFHLNSSPILRVGISKSFDPTNEDLLPLTQWSIRRGYRDGVRKVRILLFCPECTRESRQRRDERSRVFRY